MPDHRTMVTEIAEIASEVLNEYECDFIQNMLEEWEGEFSPKQAALIEKCYKKVCDSPH